MCSDAYLAKLLKHIGLSDAAVGVISSFVSFAFLFGLLSILLMEFRLNIKRTVLIFDTASQLFFFSLFLIPFMPAPQEVRSVLVTAAVLAGYFCKYLIASMYFKWANSFVDPAARGRFSASKEMVSLIAGMAFTLFAGFMVDRLEARGDLLGAFLFIAVTILVLNVVSFLSLLSITGDPAQSRVPSENGKRLSLREVTANTLGNKRFREILVMTSLWEIGRYLTLGFLGTFKTHDLLLSVGVIQLINTAANAARFAVTRPLGVYSDRRSFAAGYRLAMCIAAAGFLVNVFTNNSAWWLIIVFTLLYHMAQAGTVQNGSNVIYDCVAPEYIAQAIAIRSAVGGLLGFAASLAGGRILTAVQAHGLVIGGVSVYGQQVLSAISFVVIAADVFYIALVVEKHGKTSR